MGAGSSKKSINVNSSKSDEHRFRCPAHKSSLLSSLPGEITSITHLIRDRFDTFHGKVFLSYLKNGLYKECTYAEVMSCVRNLGGAMAQICPSKWDGSLNCFGICTSNMQDWVVADLACCLYGRIPVPMDLSLSRGELARIVEETEMKTLLCDYLTYDRLVSRSTVESELKHILISDYWPENPIQRMQLMSTVYSEGRYVDKEPIERSGNADIAICYTRGTTGLRKGVKITNAGMIAHIAALGEAMPIDNSDVIFSYQTLASVFERNLLYYALEKGAKVMFPDLFTARNHSSLLQHLKIRRPTVMRADQVFLKFIDDHLLIPVDDSDKRRNALNQKKMKKKFRLKDYDECFQYDRESVGGELRLIVTEVSSSDASFLEELKMKLCCPILEAYGLTEAMGYVCISGVQDPYVGRVGGPTGAFELQLTKEYKPEGNESDANEELLVRMAFPFGGYWPTRSLDETLDTKLVKNGWLSTKDHFSREELTGSFIMIGRTHEPLPGTSTFPTRVEAIIGTLPIVNQCWVHHHADKLIAVVKPRKQQVRLDYNMGEDIERRIAYDDKVKLRILKEITTIGAEFGLKDTEIPTICATAIDKIWLEGENRTIRRKQLPGVFFPRIILAINQPAIVPE